MNEKKGLDKNGLPRTEGVYLIKDPLGSNGGDIEIEVYEHPRKGLCCFSENYGATEVYPINDDTDCHVSVQCTGIKFITKLRDLDGE